MYELTLTFQKTLDNCNVSVIQSVKISCGFVNIFEITVNLFKLIFCTIWHDFQSVL